MNESAASEAVEEQTQPVPEGLKVLLTSEAQPLELISKLANLEVEVQWQQLSEPLKNLEESFNFRQLKPSFDFAEQQGLDLVIAVDDLTNRFSLGVRKSPTGGFMLFNIHHTSLLLAKLLLENHDKLSLKKSIFVTDLLDKLFSKTQSSVTTLATLSSPITAQESFLQSEEDGTLYISENHEIQLKGQHDSMGYLLSRLLLAAKKAKSEDQTLFDHLVGIYKELGFQREKNLAVSIEEPSQKAFFKKIMTRLKKKPPQTLGMTEVVSIEDLSNSTLKNLLSGRIVPSKSPVAPALQIQLSSSIRILIFPQGDKINFFFTSQGRQINKDNFSTLGQELDQQVVKLIAEINRLGRDN
jgi:hypothetical protein